MSKYINDKIASIEAYVPGEQPRDKKYVKLNTNECPFPPSPYAMRLARQAAGGLNLYSDPECGTLAFVAAEYFGVKKENFLFTNGSDEVLNFAFIAFCDKDTPAVFPDITYGFYPVFADLNGVPYREIPLKSDLSVAPQDYYAAGGTVFLANPNAPTARALSIDEIEGIVLNNPNNVVVVDEAYVDFGDVESALSLINKYDNILVTRTFSKSRSLAGARLGMGFASENLIAALKKVKYSTNPYNVNSMTAAAGVGAILDEEYFRKNVEIIGKNRDYLTKKLSECGFEVYPSSANFVLASSKAITGKDYYLALKERGVLVRYFDKPRLQSCVRITVGTKEEIDALIAATMDIREAKK